MSTQNGQGRKRKTFYRAQPFKRKRYEMAAGLKGFLCTCNGHAKDCVKEAYNILNEYADKLYSPETNVGNSNKERGGSTVDSELENEIAALKAEAEKEERRFQSVDTDVNGCVFIKTLLEDPVELVLDIANDIQSTKKSKTKTLLRLLPVEVICKAYLDDIKKAADKLFDKHFKGEQATYAIRFNRRHNNNVLRDEVIEALAILVRDKNPSHKAELKTPQRTILVEVIKNLCCLSVVPRYNELQKLNLLELSIVAQAKPEPDAGKGTPTEDGKETSIESKETEEDNKQTLVESKEIKEEIEETPKETATAETPEMLKKENP